MRLENIPVEKDETADNVFSKAEKILKERCPNLSGNSMIVPIKSGATINVIKPIRHAAVS